MSRVDPQTNSSFRIEIDGVIQGFFSEVTIPDSSSDPIEFRNGDDPLSVRKIPGLIKNSNIVLKWGITDSMELFEWYEDTIIKGKMQRKNVSIILLNELQDEVARWNFFECWPTKLDAPDLNATGNEIAIETLEIVTERMERVR